MCDVYLKADVFALPVTVQPQHQVVDTLALLLEVAAHMGLTGGGSMARHSIARHNMAHGGEGGGVSSCRAEQFAAAPTGHIGTYNDRSLKRQVVGSKLRESHPHMQARIVPRTTTAPTMKLMPGIHKHTPMMACGR